MGLPSKLTCGLLVGALAIAGCGGGGSKKKSPSTATVPATSTTASSDSAKEALRQYQNAVFAAILGRRNFLSREKADARANNLDALKGDAAQYRTVIFNFDGAIRKIQMPASVQTDLNTVLDANKTLISDLDAIGGVPNSTEFNRFVHRVNSDYNALAVASDKVSGELRQLSGGTSSTTSTTTTSTTS
jgi:hypothetical protein